MSRGLLCLALPLALIAGCSRAPDGNPTRGEPVAVADAADPADPAAPLRAALEPLWDNSTFLDVTLQEARPRLRWHERGISIRAMGQRPLLVVQEEDYDVDPTALQPRPKVTPPADGSKFWMVQFDCLKPGCLAVESKGSDGRLSERRGANIWLARDEAAARRLAAALAAVIAPAG